MVDWAYLCLTAADHITMLEAEVNEQARLLGDSGSTEARLRDRIKELEAENQRLRDGVQTLLLFTPYTKGQVGAIAALLQEQGE
jgi:hypothetical protein